MKHLYFMHSNGTYSLVATDIDTDFHAWAIIVSDLRKRNPEFSITQQRNYTDINGKRWFDVGAKEERYVIF